MEQTSANIACQYMIIDVFLKDCKHALKRGLSVRFSKKILDELRNAILFIVSAEEKEQHTEHNIDNMTFIVNISMLIDRINTTQDKRYIEEFIVYFECWLEEHKLKK
jgi:hypothetical protein